LVIKIHTDKLISVNIRYL